MEYLEGPARWCGNQKYSQADFVLQAGLFVYSSVMPRNIKRRFVTAANIFTEFRYFLLKSLRDGMGRLCGMGGFLRDRRRTRGRSTEDHRHSGLRPDGFQNGLVRFHKSPHLIIGLVFFFAGWTRLIQPGPQVEWLNSFGLPAKSCAFQAHHVPGHFLPD